MFYAENMIIVLIPFKKGYKSLTISHRKCTFGAKKLLYACDSEDHKV